MELKSPPAPEAVGIDVTSAPEAVGIEAIPTPEVINHDSTTFEVPMITVSVPLR